MENYDIALRDYSTAIRLNPHIPAAYFNRGLVSMGLKRYEQAIEDLDRFLDYNPRDADAYYRRAVAHERIGDREKAGKDFQQAARFGSVEAKNALRLREQR